MEQSDTILGYLARWSAERPNAPALQALAGRPRTLTYRELEAHVAAASHAMLGAGLHAGDRVVLITNHDERLVVGMLAASSIGAVGMPVSGPRAAAAAIVQAYERHARVGGVWYTRHYIDEAREIVRRCGLVATVDTDVVATLELSMLILSATRLPSAAICGVTFRIVPTS